jgi:hypothetical protein
MDQTVIETIRKNPSAITQVPKEQVVDLIKSVPKVFKYITEPTPQMCLEAVKHSDKGIRHVPTALLTKELCHEAVKRCGMNIVCIPNNFLTKELYLDAVKQNYRVFKLVPHDMQTKEMCLIAVEQDAWYYHCISPHLKMMDNQIELVKKNGEILKSVYQFDVFLAGILHDPYNIRFTDAINFPIFNIFGMSLEQRHILALKAVTINGKVLMHIGNPPSDVCAAAVMSTAAALQYVPTYHQTDELVKMAMAKDICSFKFASNWHKTPERCLMAVKHDGLLLVHINREKQTEEIKLAAIKNNIASYAFVSNKTKELDEKMVQANYLVVQCIQPNHQTDKICYDLVSRKVGAHKFIKRDDPELWLKLYNIDPNIFPDIPEKARSEELYYNAVTDVGLAQVPSEFKTERICLKAVNHNKKDIEFVQHDQEWFNSCLNTVLTDGKPETVMDLIPIEKQLFDTCVKAVTNNYRELKFMPICSPSDDVFSESLLSQTQWLHLYKIAIKQNPKSIKNLKRWRFTTDQMLELFWEAIKLDIRYLNDITSAQIGKDKYTSLCRSALSLTPNAIKYIEYEFRSDEFLKQAVATDGLAIRHVYDQTEELQLLAVTQTSDALQEIKKHTVKLVTAALENCVTEFIMLRTDFVKENLVPKKIYRFKIRQNGESSFLSTSSDPITVITEKVGPVIEIDDIFNATSVGSVYCVLQGNTYHVYSICDNKVNNQSTKFVKILTCKIYDFQ